MADITDPGLLEFQDDYFSSVLGSADSSDDGETAEMRPSLKKSLSTVSLCHYPNSGNQQGIMFNGLRTLPTSSISLQNARLDQVKRGGDVNDHNNANEDEYGYDLPSLLQQQSAISAVVNPEISMIDHEYENEQNSGGDDISGVFYDDSDSFNTQTSLERKFPYQFTCDEALESPDESESTAELFSKRQHFFILSAAGKPIYSMHGSSNIFVVYSGIIQTVVSFFKYSNDPKKIKMIESKDAVSGNPIKFVFLDKSPIILMTIIKSEQATYLELEQQLDFIYSFIIATLTRPYIEKIFKKFENFDLRNLLGPTDLLTLDSICYDLSNSLNASQILGGLECLKLHASIRARLDNKLLNFRSENLLYALIIGPNGKLISIMRQKRHMLHTSDIMVLFEMIYNTNTFKTASTVEEGEPQNNGKATLITNETFWVPICMPKFNSTGHLYNLIQFHQVNDERLFKLHDIDNKPEYKKLDEDLTKIGIILITPYKDLFTEMKKISSEILKAILLDRKIYKDIWNSLAGNGKILVHKVCDDKNGSVSRSLNKRRSMSMSISSLVHSFNGNVAVKEPSEDFGEVVHFAVKSKKLAQCIFPESEQYDINDAKVKSNLLKVYKYLRRKLQILLSDSLVFNSNDERESNGKLVVNDFINLNNTVVCEYWEDKDTHERLVGFACTFGSYEVYIISEKMMDEKKILGMGLKIVKWCRKNENRLFINTGCIF